MTVPPKKIVSETLTLMSAALGLVAALAWNDAVRELINRLVPKGQNILSHFIYAIIVTIIVVMINTRLVRIRDEFATNEEKRP